MSSQSRLPAARRKATELRASLDDLASRVESATAFAEKAVSELESELRSAKTMSISGLNLPDLRNALCQDADAGTEDWLPYTVASCGSGPWESAEFNTFLEGKGFEIVGPPDHDVEVLVLGASDWIAADLAKQIFNRTSSDLRVYTQELLVLGLVLRQDPYAILAQEAIDEVAKHHEGIQFLLDRDFSWPAWPEGVVSDEGEGSHDFEGEPDWAQESVLRHLGYSARMDGPSDETRRSILKLAFQTEELEGLDSAERRAIWGSALSPRRLHAISSFLSWLIAFKGGESEQARAKWVADLGWLRDRFYKPTMSFAWPYNEHARVQKPLRRRTPNAEFMKALRPSPELAAIVGDAPLPRTEVVSKLWAYIKRNKLQDAVNKRMVNADAKLKAVFGKPQVSMFEMAGLIGRHVR